MPNKTVPVKLVRRNTPEFQIERLAKYIMENVPGEPSQSEGAVDCAIRIMERQRKELAAQGGLTVMDTETFGSLLTLLMCSDPWPTSSPEDEKLLEEYADAEAQRYGYTDWIEAFHAL